MSDLVKVLHDCAALVKPTDDGVTYGLAGLCREAADELERHRHLAEVVDRMMAAVGYHGEISARDDRVQAVMNALHKVDPK